MGRRRHISYPLCGLLVLLAGCERPVVIQGKVVDIHGEALPGVAVTVRGTEYEAVTDGLGAYSLSCAPGTLTLDVMKTGYTQGVLQVEAKDRIAVDVRDAVLWPLPGRKGVYLFENFKYREATRAEPKRYVAPDGKPVFAVKKDPELETQTPLGGERTEGTPLLICFKQPDYDVALHRMCRMEVTLPQQRAPAPVQPGSAEAPAPPVEKETVSAPADRVACLVIPIDEQDKLLLEVRPMAPLSPGVYAVHWGALEGHTATDPYVFLFRVAEPQTSAEAQSGDADEKK